MVALFYPSVQNTLRRVIYIEYNVEFSQVGFYSVHMRPISQPAAISYTKKNMLWKLLPHPTGAN